MNKQIVWFSDLGKMEYKEAWDYQESLLRQNLNLKSELAGKHSEAGHIAANRQLPTENYLLFVEHTPVYTLGKSGNIDNVLIDEYNRAEKGIQFFHTNRGGDITYHGPGQIVGYPILDLENFLY